MVIAAASVVIGPFIAGILVCAFIAVLFGPRGIWPAGGVLMVAFAVSVLGWAGGCLGIPFPVAGDAGATCAASGGTPLALLASLLGVPLACLMIAAAAIIVERAMGRPTIGPPGLIDPASRRSRG